ncbi:hypothetical protein B0H12DRAFT_1106698 [Mycena haematopus]|nr:hypothetical protein B0H12DRAFT_1106698 [Mycena haematopus]
MRGRLRRPLVDRKRQMRIAHLRLRPHQVSLKTSSCRQHGHRAPHPTSSEAEPDPLLHNGLHRPLQSLLPGRPISPRTRCMLHRLAHPPLQIQSTRPYTVLREGLSRTSILAGLSASPRPSAAAASLASLLDEAMCVVPPKLKGARRGGTCDGGATGVARD